MSEDLTMLANVAAAHSSTIMARAGRLPLASYIKTPDGVQMLVAGATDEVNKRMFAAVTKVCGARHRSTCTAIVMETWTVLLHTPEDERLLRDMQTRGAPASDHPNAVERVLLVAGDTRSQDVREYDIVRHHDAMVELRLVKQERLEGDACLKGMLMDLQHSPDDLRNPAFLEIMRDMEEMGLLRGTPVRASTRGAETN
jgi:hypothetical protein